ncbi:MAG: bifunctional phosphopantothenoylcysteine decarboxylase/phosphopantothenate--cysteine ligase CoaBC [Deltaproteobacteria bacterium]|nr:bifunctional phosphopantothenoylcysteine decarboxylase/phosphopantothenate--cysteine ligase CoaBC [Deltaproteobacteria bacterium]
MLENRQVILGVSGSIAAYKAAYLARRLVEAQAEVYPILTAAASRFVGPLTFSVLTGHKAIVDMWSASEAGEVSHVALATRADLLLIAPATADLIARLATGRADEPLTAVALATRAPTLIAPAMETGMWENPATQAHVRALQDRGVRFVMPETGALASGASGVGRLADVETILEAAVTVLGPRDLVGQRLLVTAGPTREHFDPVRFVSNASSGKMGFAIATAARRRGAEVTLVAGPTLVAPPAGVDTVRVETTAEMLDACRRQLAASTVVVMAAAPVDHRPSTVAATKTKKTAIGARTTVELEATPDILMTLKPELAGKVVVGFAAETDQVARHAAQKLTTKGLDLVVANDVTERGAGFGTDTNSVLLIDRDGGKERLPLMSKLKVADDILDRVVKILGARGV